MQGKRWTADPSVDPMQQTPRRCSGLVVEALAELGPVALQAAEGPRRRAHEHRAERRKLEESLQWGSLLPPTSNTHFS